MYVVRFYFNLVTQHNKTLLKSTHKVLDGTFPIVNHTCTKWPFSCDIIGITRYNHDVSQLTHQQTVSIFWQSLADQIIRLESC